MSLELILNDLNSQLKYEYKASESLLENEFYTLNNLLDLINFNSDKLYRLYVAKRIYLHKGDIESIYTLSRFTGINIIVSISNAGYDFIIDLFGFPSVNISLFMNLMDKLINDLLYFSNAKISIKYISLNYNTDTTSGVLYELRRFNYTKYEFKRPNIPKIIKYNSFINMKEINNYKVDTNLQRINYEYYLLQ